MKSPWCRPYVHLLGIGRQCYNRLLHNYYHHSVLHLIEMLYNPARSFPFGCLIVCCDLSSHNQPTRNRRVMGRARDKLVEFHLFAYLLSLSSIISVGLEQQLQGNATWKKKVRVPATVHVIAVSKGSPAR